MKKKFQDAGTVFLRSFHLQFSATFVQFVSTKLQVALFCLFFCGGIRPKTRTRVNIRRRNKCEMRSSVVWLFMIQNRFVCLFMHCQIAWSQRHLLNGKRLAFPMTKARRCVFLVFVKETNQVLTFPSGSKFQGKTICKKVPGSVGVGVGNLQERLLLPDPRWLAREMWVDKMWTCCAVTDVDIYIYI